MARKGYPRVAGVIENVGPSRERTGDGHSGVRFGWGQELAEAIGVPLLASVPLDASGAHSRERALTSTPPGREPMLADFGPVPGKKCGWTRRWHRARGMVSR